MKLTPERRKELDAELASLNEAVNAALSARKKWMDDHMAIYAGINVGDDLYHLTTGTKVGVVTGFYRFHDEQRNVQYDTSMSVEIEYRDGPNTVNRTGYKNSRYDYGTKEECAHLLRQQARDAQAFAESFSTP